MGGTGNGKLICGVGVACHVNRANGACNVVRTATIDSLLAVRKPPSIDVVKVRAKALASTCLPPTQTDSFTTAIRVFIIMYDHVLITAHCLAYLTD
jgi:hypothetical protein